LKGRNEIRDVFSRGRSAGCRGAKLFVLKNSLPYNRICFTLSRKFGNAVERNRARRLCREAYRLMRPGLLRGFDFVLLVYAPDAAIGTKGKAGTRAGAARQAEKTEHPEQGRKSGLAVRSEQLRFLFTKAGLMPPGGGNP
jgi:ribonuclease P protein component